MPRWSLDYGAKRIVDRAVDTGIDHIFVQVYANGEPIYPSRILKPNLRFSKENDPFTIILNRAHHYGIKVHAWLNIFYIWSYAPKPTDPNHPLNANWGLYDRSGRSMKHYSTTKLKRMGIEGYYASPYSLSYKKLILSIIDELLTNYNFDGIHLDYIRYPDLNFGYDLMSRTTFMRRYYCDPIRSRDQSLQNILGRDGRYHLQVLYKKHLIKGMSDFVHSITEFVHRRKSIPVSAAVKPDPVKAKNNFGQDWINWLANSNIDFVITMSYTPSTSWIIRTISGLPYRNRIWIGIGTYIMDKKSITNQVTTLRRKGYHNLVIFSFEDLRKRPWVGSCWQ